MGVPSLDELQQDIDKCIKSETDMRGILSTVYENILEFDATEPYTDIFNELVGKGYVDRDEVTDEYEKGLKTFFAELVREIDKLKVKMDTFIPEIPSELAKKLFHSDFIVGCTLSDEKCIEKCNLGPEEQTLLPIFSKICLMKEKHEDSLRKLKRLARL